MDEPMETSPSTTAPPAVAAADPTPPPPPPPATTGEAAASPPEQQQVQAPPQAPPLTQQEPPPPSSIPSTTEIALTPPPASPFPAPPKPTANPPPPQPHPPPSQPQLPPQSQPTPPTQQQRPETTAPLQQARMTQPQTPQQPQQQQLQQQQPSFQHPQQRPPLARSRPPYGHFPQHHPSPSSSSPLPSHSITSSAPLQRGGLAIGVPAHHPRAPQQGPVSFSSFGSSPPFSQPFSGLTLSSVGAPDQTSSSSTQVRQPIQGIQNIGMVGALSTASQIRPSGLSGNHQQRPGQPTLRSTSPSNNQSLTNQNSQGHSLLRVPSVTSPSSPSPGTPQSSQPFQQPWMSAQGKTMHAVSLSSPLYRTQMKSQVLQQRPHQPQQHQHSMLATSQQQQMPAARQQQQQQSQPQQQKQLQQQLQQQQKQPQQQQQLPQQQQPPHVSLPRQSQGQNSQQHQPSKIQQSMPQQQVSRAHGSASQKSLVPANLQPGAIQHGPITPIASTDTSESGNRILSKRSIHELVTQIDPSEKLDPEVEDILMEIADDFIESTTTFACSLAKHRNSTTLEAKDILLHLERNWNMTLPGFGGDEIKCYKKPHTNDIHKERLAMVRKSMVGTPDAGNVKNSTVGQGAPNMKGHTIRAPAIGSPKIT